ncbi:enhanced serine sensitivity protein SseB C-terminal domain-containing protein [Rhodanobacter geophilus]|uniref:Enhanced serine sensitivity protein SseB C-terminal domain-containing protein n=1 Tax=Rhodanobacter geophilus TaxID=3162488 RepID=A0ABV3QPJ5_9GAMM
MTSTAELQRLLEAAKNDVRAEEAFLAGLLSATVYAHVPRTPPPTGKMQFVQFVRPDNGQTVLPFFSDQAKAQFAGRGRVGIVSMAGRRLLELTQGATLMLNPNDDGYVLYPEEVSALLTDRPLGIFVAEQTTPGETVGLAAPSVPVDALVNALAGYLGKEPAVQAGYLMELHRGKDLADVSLLIALVVLSKEAERIARGSMVAAQPVLQSLTLPLLIMCHTPEEPLPPGYEEAICFYGNPGHASSRIGISQEGGGDSA